MRIAHVSDVHLRNLKYRDEYRAAFEDLYEQLERLKPDLIINTGDLLHSKLSVSPELFHDAAEHMRGMSNIAPYWLILGNHDLNLKNRDRTDAVSPIVSALRGATVNPVELLGPGRVLNYPQISPFRFWHFDIRRSWGDLVSPDPGDINIGLYHGSVAGCTTDMGFVMDDVETEVSAFDHMDFVMMGDIHKRQSFRGGRMQYPGSLIQQNYGEELEKGFLLWDIASKDDFGVGFHPIVAPGRFFTIQVPPSFDLSDLSVPSGSRIRAMVAGDLSPSQRWDLEKKIRAAFDPIEVITPDTSGERQEFNVTMASMVGSREMLMRDFLVEKGASEDLISEVVGLFGRFERTADSDGSARGTTWRLKNLSWDDMMNYGSGNSIDLTKLSGLVGIFAPNASGKSSIFDIMLQALFDKTSKEIPRNIDLVNDNKDLGRMAAVFESAGQEYTIQREIERLHYGQRKLPETKQWGKTALDFSQGDEQLNGTSRPETERTIRQIIGSFEDFVLTSMVSQAPIFGIPGGADILNCKETDRRKILFRFLDLDLYERIHGAARDDLKELMGGLKADRAKLVERSEGLLVTRAQQESAVIRIRTEISTNELELSEIRTALRAVIDVEQAAIEFRDAEHESAELSTMLDGDLDRLHEAEGKLSAARDVEVAHLFIRPDGPEVSLDDIAVRSQEIERRISSDNSELSRQRTNRSQGEKSLETLDGIPCEGKFPTCRFISDALAFVDQRQVIQAAIDELTERGVIDESERRTLDQHRIVHRGLADWERRRAQLELESSREENRVNILRATVETRSRLLESARARFAEATKRADRSSIENITGLREQERSSSDALVDLRCKLDSETQALGVAIAHERAACDELLRHDKLKDSARSLEMLVSMTGKNGLPYKILAMVLPAINAEISKILTGIVKFSVFFEDDPDEQTVSLFIRYGDYKSRPLSLGSGAEKFIASLAIRAALLSVSSLPKTDILIIDEGFGKLDPEHLESVQRMFEHLRTSFGTVFVVSHVDMMRDIVDHSIDIISCDGYAHVEAS